jgi:hypothetical protein
MSDPSRPAKIAVWSQAWEFHEKAAAPKLCFTQSRGPLRLNLKTGITCTHGAMGRRPGRMPARRKAGDLYTHLHRERRLDEKVSERANAQERRFASNWTGLVRPSSLRFDSSPPMTIAGAKIRNSKERFREVPSNRPSAFLLILARDVFRRTGDRRSLRPSSAQPRLC